MSSTELLFKGKNVSPVGKQSSQTISSGLWSDPFIRLKRSNPRVAVPSTNKLICIFSNEISTR